MEQSFEDLLNEAWNRLEPLRDSTNDEPLLKWQKLSELTSENGILCGLSVYGKSLFGRKAIAEIHLAYDPHQDCYRISSWRKGYVPLEVFPGEGSDERPSLDSAVRKMDEMIGKIRPLLAEGKIKTSYPPEWIGKSGLALLKEAISRKQ